MIKFFHVDTNPLLRDRIAVMVHAQSDMKPVAEATNGQRRGLLDGFRPRRARLGSILLAFVAAATASAQPSGGAVRGTVSDPSGASVQARLSSSKR
jgi:hypothetical protein